MDRDPAGNPIPADIELEAQRQVAVASLGEFALRGASQDQLMSHAIAVCADLLPADFVKVLELLPGDGELLLRAGEGWRHGAVGAAIVPNDSGSQAGFTLLTDEPVLVNDLDLEERFTAPQLLMDHAVRSGVSVVIRGAVRPFGVLAVHSRTPGAFEENDAQFMMSLANVLGSAFRHKKVEDELSALAEISRVATSSADMSDVYERLADSVGRLIAFDRMVVALVDAEMAYDAYVTGTDIPKYRSGTRYPLGESGAALFESSRTPLVIDCDEHVELYRESMEDARAAGLKSMLVAPLVWNATVIGSLQVRSKQARIYGPSDIEVIAKIADQIAGPIANAQLHQQALREAEERRTLAEIGRIISSSFDIDEVYERFSASLRRLIPFDRLVISLLDPDSGVDFDAHIHGEDLPSYRKGVPHLYKASAAALFEGRLDPLVIDESVIEQHPFLQGPQIEARAAGLKSFMAAPLIWRSEVIGTLNFRSKEPDAYGPREVAAAGRAAAQIVSAIAGARAYTALSALQEVTEASVHDLNERVKELTCLYRVVDLLRSNVPLEEVAWDIANLIPPGWQYPEITVARVTLGNLKFQSEGYVETEWRMSSDIIVDGLPGGTVEVCYTEPRRKEDEGPFLDEERSLLDRIANLLSEAVERRAAEREARLQSSAVRASLDGVLAANRSGEIVMANPAAAGIFGVENPAYLFGRSIVDLMPERYRSLHMEGLRRLSRGGEAHIIGRGSVEVEALRPDGSEVPIEMTLNRLAESGPAAYVAVLRDITERREAERESRLRAAAIEAAADMVVITDSDGVIEYVNEAFTRETGYTPAEVIGGTTRILKSGAHDAAFYAQLWSTIKAGRVWQGEMINRRKNGTDYPEEMTITPILGEDGEITNFVAVKRDISERKRNDEELVRLATTDTLTGLLNRHQFSVMFEQAVELLRRRDGQGALITMDLDGFKYVNDAYGHRAGDEMLALIARCLQQRLRASDTVARTGGDEFAVILHDASPKDALAIADELVSLIADCSLEIDGQRVSVTSSAGVARFPDGDASPLDLMAFADIAIYAAKDSGRNRAVLYSDLDRGRDTVSSLQRARIMIVDALRDDRLKIYWQPIVSTTDLQPYKYEVLARLEDSEGVIRPPGEFLPQADALDLMDDIDRRVVGLALRAGADHHRSGDPVRLAVNISARSLTGEMAEYIIQTASETGYPLTYLIVEITETTVLAVNGDTRAVLARLVDAGVSLSMDDFGSGATLFRNLEELPFKYMKLDGAYVQDLATNRRGRELVAGLAQLAHTLGLEVIAEYVQDDATIEFLRKIGVEFAQGFHLGEPVPVPPPAVAAV